MVAGMVDIPADPLDSIVSAYVAIDGHTCTNGLRAGVDFGVEYSGEPSLRR